MSPSLFATELTAAPYLGKGLGWDVVKLKRRWAQGYREALALPCGGGAEGATLRGPCCGQRLSRKETFIFHT